MQRDYAAEERLQEFVRECKAAGRDSDKDVEFWFRKLEECTKGETTEGMATDVMICLQMAAIAGPDWHVVLDSKGHADVFPPGQEPKVGFFSFLRKRPERLDSFVQRMLSGKA